MESVLSEKPRFFQFVREIIQTIFVDVGRFVVPPLPHTMRMQEESQLRKTYAKILTISLVLCVVEPSA
jgi:hypothetical protein